LVRKGIASILGNEQDMELVGEGGNGLEAVEMYRKLSPDVTLMDLHMPEMDGVAATERIIAADPAARIIALTSYYGDHEIYSALEAGVRGYILKHTVHTEVVRAIRSVYYGERLMAPEVAGRLNESAPQAALTKREIEVLRIAAQGLGNKEIAEHLGVTAGTAKMHLHSIFFKLGVSGRTEAVTHAVRRGIIRLDS
jgi:DNA-binding NarL/FixJ family response regulator